jgi:cytochrome c oxidase subunit 2
MIGKLKVVSREDFNKYMEQGQEDRNLPLAKKGEKLFAVKACASCHSVDSPAIKVGPSLYKSFGREEEMDDGSKVVIDENYLLESINQPNKRIVKGFGKGVMPSYQGQLNDSELAAIVEYIKELK